MDGTCSVSIRGFRCFKISAKSVAAIRVSRGLGTNLSAREKSLMFSDWENFAQAIKTARRI